MQEYLNLEFKDDSMGRLQMGEAIKSYSKVGWQVMNKVTTAQGYSLGKTVALGAIFLPLALFGKKNDKITITLIREKKQQLKQTPQQEEDSEKFMKSGQVLADGTMDCPKCYTNIKTHEEKGSFFFKKKIYTCSKCGHIICD